MRVSIEVAGEEVLDRAFSRFGDFISDFKESGTWEKIYTEFRDIEREAFFSSGASQGSPWKDLDKQYEDYKALKWAFMPILRREDKLYRSLVFKNTEGAVYDPQPKELTLGSSVRSKRGFPYPRAHQEGKGVPKRPPISLTEKDKRRFTKVFHRELLRAKKIAGFGGESGIELLGVPF